MEWPRSWPWARTRARARARARRCLCTCASTWRLQRQWNGTCGGTICTWRAATHAASTVRWQSHGRSWSWPRPRPWHGPGPRRHDERPTTRRSSRGWRWRCDGVEPSTWSWAAATTTSAAAAAGSHDGWTATKRVCQASGSRPTRLCSACNAAAVSRADAPATNEPRFSGTPTSWQNATATPLRKSSHRR